MTQEQKAKAYDKALERAKEYHFDGAKQYIIDTLEYIFPELAESEDEKIRKAILNYFIKCWGNSQDDVCGVHVEDVIAWLEKQGQQKPFDYENANIQQKDFAPKVEPKFKVGDRIIEKDLDEYDYGTIKDIKYGKYFFKDGTYIDIQEQDSWQLVKESSIEQKFHEGDWVIFNNNHDSIYQIEKIENYRYYLRHYLGGSMSVHFDNELIRLWTIKDARDGDILALKRDKSPFIFKGFDIFHPECPVAYCGIDEDGIFIVNSGDGWWTQEEVYPATKEQRDLLFQKMKEEGYEWGAEKKELKKIEFNPDDLIEEAYQQQADDLIDMVTEKPAWGEEDEHWRQKAVDFMKHPDLIKATPTLAKGTISWLKSLGFKNRWKPSDEQMKALHDLNLTGNISYAGQGQELINLYNDLKKLIEE